MLSIRSLLAQLGLGFGLLFDHQGAQGGAVQLGRGAQGAEGIVAGATEAAFQGGSRERPHLVISAERARAEVTEG